MREQVVHEEPVNVASACAKSGAAVIGTEFLYELLTNPQTKYGSDVGIWISQVTIVGEMKLTYGNIPTTFRGGGGNSPAADYPGSRLAYQN